MKPLGFALDEMRELLQLLDALAEDTTPDERRTTLQERLAMFHAAADARVQALRDRLATAVGFAEQMREQVTWHHR